VTVGRLLSTLAGGAARRPRRVLIAALLIALVSAALALRLHPTAATSTFVSSSSPEYVATQRFYGRFGEEPVEVLVKGNLQKLVLSADLARLVGLEGCLSGNLPAAAIAREGGAAGPCGQLSRAHSVKVVLGPGTFVNEAATLLDEQLTLQTRQAHEAAAQAERVVTASALRRGRSSAEAHALGRQASRITIARFEESLAVLALRYGVTSQPSLDNTNFVSALVFDPAKPAGTPKQRFAYLFPSRNAALISVRMRSGLSEAAREHTIGLIRRAVAMPQWHLENGEAYLVTGEPVIVSDLRSSITRSLELLLLAVVIVMAGALGLLFRPRPRLLPLAIALLAAAITFGAVSLAGASLTIAQVAVLPVLVGLAVDYAIQFQSRVAEARAEEDPNEAEDDLDEVHRDDTGGRVRAVRRAAAIGAPAIATAAAASGAAMLVLLLSPVPMVRSFGVLLVVGIAIAFGCTLAAGSAALAYARARPRVSPHALASSRFARALAGAWLGARELLRENALTRLVSGAALVRAVARPRLFLAVGLALAALGWGLDTQTHVETDITKLVPSNLASLANLTLLERESGVGGEIDVMVEGRNLATPRTLEWMSSYEGAMLRRFGYSASRGCGRARLCPAFSLPDLFRAEGAAGLGVGPASSSSPSGKLTQAGVNALLGAIPPYFSVAVITADRRAATLAFGIRLQSLSAQQRLIDTMRASLHPPPGLHAELVGLPVIAARSGTEVASSSRRLLTLLAGLAAVALVLLLAFAGDVRRALVPLVPIVLATGWSALVLFAIRVPLNPMSVTLGALVIAISTEFSVLLAERYRQERADGTPHEPALRRAWSRTGAAIAASGVTAIAGFGVLVLSDIRMLRDFGLVTLVDLSVSLLGVLVALPAALTLVGSLPDRSALRARSARARQVAGVRVWRGRAGRWSERG
jgi:predicted RND superfamily exporter protein